MEYGVVNDLAKDSHTTEHNRSIHYYYKINDVMWTFQNYRFITYFLNLVVK